MTLWLLVSLALAVAILLLAPQQLPVTLYKLSLITVAAWLGYWIDRGLFPYARPDAFIYSGSCQPRGAYGHAFEAAMLRRALVVAACIVGVALGA
jgi:hypothetical protein